MYGDALFNMVYNYYCDEVETTTIKTQDAQQMNLCLQIMNICIDVKWN